MARGPKKKPKPRKPSTLRPRDRARQGAAARSGPALSASPKSQALVVKAQKAWEQRQFDDAIRLYERAVALEPACAVLLVDLARAYALRYRHAEAEAIIERATRLQDSHPELQRMLGRSFMQLQQYDRAIDCFKRSLELDPSGPQRAHSLYELAHMYERLHKLDEARACAEESLSLAPHQPVLRYILAVINRRRGDKQSAQASLQAVIASPQAIPETVADAWYQQAAIDDSEGRFPEAFAAASRAKQTLEKIAGPHKYDAADIAETSRRTVRTTTQDHFDRWAAGAGALKPWGRGLALLTSHPRSGTTLLEQVLDSHPLLISADELQVLADVVYLPLCQTSPVDTPVPEILDAIEPPQLDLVRQSYWEAMQGALREPIGDRILLDKNPAMTNLLPLAARVFPEMKIVFAVRDPRDVVVSCFLQQLPLNPVSVHYLTLPGTAEHYAATMRTWLKLRDMIHNPWIEVRYEDTVADLERQARRVIDFLGLPWDDSVLEYRRRAQQKHVHSPTYEAVTKPVYSTSIGRWRHYAAQLEPCLSVLQPFVEAFGYA